MKGDTNLQNHSVELLENGEEFYEQAFAAIRAAESEVLLETFIWFFDDVGKQLLAALEAAVRNGASVDVTVDGYGTADIPDEYRDKLEGLGIRLHIFDPTPRLLGWRTKWVGRLHRKLLAIDGKTAFVGGINYSDEHVVANGPDSKQDYAVMLKGPVASEIRDFMRTVVDNGLGYRRTPRWRHFRKLPDDWRNAQRKHKVQFITRNNADRQDDIERYYLMSIRSAKHEIVIANAYFFPSYRMLRHLRRAVRRGVRTKLILQGNPDMEYARTAASTLYDYLLDAGVEVYEYQERPLHAKVAVFDSEWSTVGSSNLDPLSFSLNLEANLFIFDSDFGSELRGRVDGLLKNSRRLTRDEVPRQNGWRHIVRVAAFHVARRFPRWLRRYPGYHQHFGELPPAQKA